MRALIRALAAAGLAATLLVGATATVAAADRHAAAAPDYAWVRVLNAMVGGSSLDVYVTRVAVDTPPTYDDIAFGVATGYQKLHFTPDCIGKTLCNLEFAVAEHGNADAFKTSMVALRAGTHATVAVAATGSTGPVFDEYLESQSRTARSSLRFVNLTSDVTTPIDVSAVAMKGSGVIAASDLGFTQGSKARTAAPGPWNIQFRAAGSMGMALPTTNAVLVKGVRYTAYFIGELGGVGDDAARFVLLASR